MTAGESRYQVMPPLTPAELDELRRSIELHGVLQPIEVDENGEILDGHNRDMLARELGKDCPRRVVSGLGSDDNKRAYAMTVNIQRRQLTASKRKELHQKMRAEGWSVRRISAETGVPKSTVADDVAGVRSRTPEKVSTTRDGKTYKAKRTPKPKPKLREPTVPVSAGLKVVPEPEPERERDLPPMTVAPPRNRNRTGTLRRPTCWRR